MSDNYKKVEGESDLVRDMNSTAIINRNKSAYEMDPKKRSEQAKRNLWKKKNKGRNQKRNERDANTLKCEMHEIKSLLQQLVDK